MKGRLAEHAACVLMKCLYGARMARFDLLRAITSLACQLTRWTPECDRKLHRLMCYIHTSKHLRMIGYVGNSLNEVQPHLFADADFAGCATTQRSTSGLHLCIRGSKTCFPIAGQSKRQGCVSHSTPEAEIVAADFGLRLSGLPALDLWHVLLPHKPPLFFHEDNQAMIHVINTGRNPTMRYLLRTHRVSVSWLHEVFKGADIVLMYEDSAKMAADIYTKGFVDPTKWKPFCGLINIIDPKLLNDKNYVRLYLTHAPPSDGGIPKRIETPEGLPSKAGWHEDENGRPVCVIKEAKQYRTPEFKCDPKVWMFRTTWLLQNGAWVKVEDRVRWKDLQNSRADIRPIANKAIFRFESQLVAAGAQVVKTINVISEYSKRGIVNISDIVIKNGRISQLSGDDARTLVNIALSVHWPPMTSAGDCAGSKLHGGHFGPYRRQNMRRISCQDMSLIVPDIECSLQDLLRPHLRKSGFQWNAIFIETGCH